MKLLVTGSSGLVGSAVVDHFCARGWRVHGIDNNQRADLFGPDGDTRWNQQRLCQAHGDVFVHHELDIRDAAAVQSLVAELGPSAIVHAAAQPSHDLAARRPIDDFGINAQGTLHLLEASRQHCPQAPFVFLSTNKVYGDAPNELPVKELPTRLDYAREADRQGIDEQLRIDRSTHSLFGASKLAADVMVQEYGRTFGLPTCCLRAGCLTGAAHSGVQLHGFLSYLTKVHLEGRGYTVFGFGGKQVRDNLHAADVASFIDAFIAAPRTAEVYNLGGGRENSCSILEAFQRLKARTGVSTELAFEDAPRHGDHRCYISDLGKARAHYPAWEVTRSLDAILDDLVDGWRARKGAA